MAAIQWSRLMGQSFQVRTLASIFQTMTSAKSVNICFF